jgi:Flp pilus assembly protein TadD
MGARWRAAWRPPILFVLCLAVNAPAAETAPIDGAAWYHEIGKTRYAAADYAGAIAAFEQAVARSPESSEFHRSLGKAYGRLAGRSNWIAAMRLAKLARLSLERAVALDGTSLPALNDLARFYDEAPGFLGGGKDKAAETRARIAALCAQSSPLPADCTR